ncbi:hypothetical protein WN53_17175 [Serratia fonticola]|uniref:hypothetical protein n=2 Tax=Serratia fonticola TaxID=47917 RepID=UPI00062A1732|nr:hypothetical protein [Serratia fonticola]AKG70708.1 hypothetical protein WN53_17175 [Serratia fonticola]CAI1873388.1 Pectate lyase superfamily protein [Serratia fonticola]
MKERRNFLRSALLSLIAAPSLINAKKNSSDLQTDTSDKVNPSEKTIKKEHFSTDSVNVKDFGAVGDWDPITSTGHDDTIAFQKAIDYAQKNQLPLKIPKARYAVSKITFSSIYNYIICDGARIYGISKKKVDCIISFYNSRETILTGSVIITSDGDKIDSTYHNNYECALRIHSETSSKNKSQMMWFDNIMISNFKNGLVIGNSFGVSEQPYLPQSEIWFTAFQTRGVLRPIYCNASNSITYFDKSLILSQKNEASDSWWDDEVGWCVRCDVGTLVFSNCELQRASRKGYCIYGKDMFFFSGIHEYSCSNYITGTVEIKNIVNGFFGSGGVTPFIISEKASGRLLLDDIRVRRSNKVSQNDYTNLIECHSHNFSLDIINCLFHEFSLDLVSGNGWFIRGGNLNIRNSRLSNETIEKAIINLNNSVNILNSVDPTGFSIKDNKKIDESGWFVTEKTKNSNFEVSSSTLFNGTQQSYSLSSEEGMITITSKEFKIINNEFILELDIYFNQSSLTNGTLVISMRLFDFRMNEITPKLILIKKESKDINLNENTTKIRVFGKKNTTAFYAKIVIETHNFNILNFTNIKILQ